MSIVKLFNLDTCPHLTDTLSLSLSQTVTNLKLANRNTESTENLQEILKKNRHAQATQLNSKIKIIIIKNSINFFNPPRTISWVQ